MLQQVCEYIHNYFIQVPLCGKYEIVGGVISPPLSLKEGQRFWLTGSALNDGLHRYPAQDLKDEVFTGEIWALAVPQALENLAEEIGAWQEKNTVSPYLSENILIV